MSSHVPARFTVVRESEFCLKPPGFKCDKPIHDQIVEPLPNTPFFMAIIGSAGSGKTSLAVNMLTSKQAYKKAFHRVHVIMPPHSVASLKNNIFKRHQRVYDELDLPTIDKILRTVQEDAEEERSSLLLMDDVTASLKNELQNMLRKAIYNRRHYRLSVLVLVQSYNAMPLSIRKTLSHFVAFKPRNKKEMENIWQELIFLPRETAEALLRWVYDKPHDFLFADVNTNSLCRNFDLIHVAEDQEQQQ
mmetsp:Transcript_36540/g.86810  ORF Transcript_36540/g.86810 Transcript_36540/m.86810 type:complete len:247 (+) Transcript_36540:1878-2618(+)